MNKNKEEAKRPDGFVQVTDSFFEFFQKYKSILIVLVGILIVIGVGNVGLNLYSESQNKEAESQLFTIEAKTAKALAEVQTLTRASNKKKSAVVSPEDKKIFQRVLVPHLKNYEKMLSQFKGVNTVGFHALKIAGIYSSYEYYQEDYDLLTQVQSSVNKDLLIFGLISFHRGTALMNLNQPKKAVDIFDEILSDDRHEYLFAESLLQKGLAYAQDKNWKQARMAYQEFKEKHLESPFLSNVNAYLRLLDLQGESAQ